MEVPPGENKKLQYIEEKIDLVDETIQQLKVLLGNANEVYCSLCKRFSQQSAQKSDKKRQKRQQKEQRKKRAKRRKKSLEKNTRNLLDCSQSPIFPWDHTCGSLSPGGPPSWSLDVSETGESTKCLWVGVMGLKASGEGVEKIGRL